MMRSTVPKQLQGTLALSRTHLPSLTPQRSRSSPKQIVIRQHRMGCSGLSPGSSLSSGLYSALGSRGSVRVHAGRAEDLSVQDRVGGAVFYLVPLLDGLRFGRFFIAQFPATAQILAPIRPLMNFYYGLPFASLVVFFGVYWVANNLQFSRHIRFNAMQALYLSLILVVPSLFEQVFRGALSGQIRISLYNTIWIFVATCVSYGIGASLLGGSARLPIVADTADQRIP